MIYVDGKPAPEIPIEKGVPIPPRTDSFLKRTSLVMDAARSMVVGDSILIPASLGKQTTGNMSRATGFKFTQRRYGDNIRIWRIE